MAEGNGQGNNLGSRGCICVGHGLHRDLTDPALGHHLPQVRHRGLGFFQGTGADYHLVPRLGPTPGQPGAEVACATEYGEHR